MKDSPTPLFNLKLCVIVRVWDIERYCLFVFYLAQYLTMTSLYISRALVDWYILQKPVDVLYTVDVITYSVSAPWLHSLPIHTAMGKCY